MRSLKTQDEEALWLMLTHAAHESSIDTVKANSDLARYVEGWGRNGDMGCICEQDELPIGAAWLRLWSAKNRGYGYVDERIPELAIAVIPTSRGQGIGTALLTRTLTAAKGTFPAVSLSIRSDNPALKLYKRLGFEPVLGSEVTNRTGSVSFTMIRQF